MAPQGKQTSFEIKHLIIKLNGEGKTIREIAELVGKPKSTVHDIIKRYRDEFRITYKSRKGQGKILNEREERGILKEIKIDPFKTAKELQVSLLNKTGKAVSLTSIRNTLHNNSFHGRIARKKPFISPKNKNLRLKFAQEYLFKFNEFWNTVLYTDESKFNLHSSDGRQYVWRKPNAEFEPKNTRATFKHGGGSIMVWGCMSSAGVGNLHFIEGKMDRFVYLNVLKENVKQSAEKLGIKENFAFYQDNDPKHTSGVAKLWLIHNCPKLLQTPPQSPDLNVVEHLWEELAKMVYTRKFNTLTQLKEVLRQEWYAIPPQVCQNLVNSMPNRLRAVVETKGYATKY